MGIFRNIWNTLFGKSKIEETTEVVELEEPKLKVVHKKKKQVAGAIYLGKEVKPKDKKTIGAYNTEDTNFNSNPVITPLPNGDDFFVSNELISKEEKSDAAKGWRTDPSMRPPLALTTSDASFSSDMPNT